MAAHVRDCLTNTNAPTTAHPFDDIEPTPGSNHDHHPYQRDQAQPQPHFWTRDTINGLTTGPRTRPSKRIAPGLEQRLRHLEEQKLRREAEARRKHSIGRILEEQLQDLERLQREREEVVEIQRRGKTWTGPVLPVIVHRTQSMPGGVRLSGGPVLTDNEASLLESDVSSIIDISDRFEVSDTEDELRDTQKYRMPDCGKTRLHLRTKEPLSPSARHVPRSPGSGRREKRDSTPTTPRSTHVTTNGHSPAATMDSSGTNWHERNSSSVTIGDGEFGPSLSRAGSIYTLGRASFTGQLAQLTSMRLPDASSLAKRISSLSSAAEAAKALSDASEQIRLWISKASDVLDGLNADDDVEWAAIGGREGIEDVDTTITKFQKLVEVYILSIEELQMREDIASLSADDIKGSVGMMETILGSWKKIKDTLKNVKEQVVIAMEWEELWNKVLGEVAQEMDALNHMVFEMEEMRHQGHESVLSSRDSIDISELETILEEQPGRGKPPTNSRHSLPQLNPNSPAIATPPTTNGSKEDSSLLALFARMQPLRAALDFLPMRLSAWEERGNMHFPSATLDLEERLKQLEEQWKKLEADAESLRRELGEDRWIMVFRNAGRQAMKMCESITRSFEKLKAAVESNERQSDPSAVNERILNYEQKKRHYGPAIQRVLAIIDRGVMDRLTVNGEILRLQSDMKRRWTALQSEMADMDVVVEEMKSESDAKEKQDKHLRDSVSTVISSERSIASSLMDTPGSSPASSVVGDSRKGSFGSRTPTPLTNIKTRDSSNPRIRLSSGSSMPRRSLLPRSSFADLHSPSPKASPSSIPTPAMTPMSKGPAWPARPEAPQDPSKARWTRLAKNEDKGFRPLSAYEPSPYAKAPVTPKTNYLRAGSKTYATPMTTDRRIFSAPTPNGPSSIPRPTTVMGTATSSRKSSLPVPSTTPSKTTTHRTLNPKKSAPSLRPGSSRTASSGRRSSLLPPIPAVPTGGVDGNEADNESPSHHRMRPPSAMASGRRSSLMPSRARSRLSESTGSQALDSKPKWRGA
ncbi:hypothetical protein CLAFUW4_09023 [Fulvia fulva]|uniref:KAR9-domain-containing protein n=1 Tax=Passalora fulva TaxID=5499 RepID=A0A9Q8PFE0_PASFU|nr:uncharacterized protein CLAFUR5_09132 [Fulvia fulva]KAK4613922.1 hypothetical protein CLAFUR4_09029 [Fulvia fulva]KAK4615015.1 hypothetical protein CLAFUR0_09021 [Fulvia fulva]UJO21425.1 hypothetical protein CLAFUR5_09132 [Fulvia fulva]WPV20079.1 hypothetical protein CLAFUW4_09023 [Fulvia fulva]WPV35479.1 hypothetical protein CLAFUW7_09024 [Fulvia fulva]